MSECENLGINGAHLTGKSHDDNCLKNDNHDFVGFEFEYVIAISIITAL